MPVLFRDKCWFFVFKTNFAGHADSFTVIVSFAIQKWTAFLERFRNYDGRKDHQSYESRIFESMIPTAKHYETRFVILALLSIATRTKVSNPTTSDKALNDKLVSIVILGVSTLSAVNIRAGVVGRPKTRPY